MSESNPRYFNAYKELFHYLNSLSNEVVALSAKQLSVYKKNFSAGWQIKTDIICEGRNITLHFLIDKSFPYSKPRMAIASHDFFLKWTHVEPKGLLCLVPEGASHDYENIKQLAEGFFGQAMLLIENGLEGNKSEFVNELLSYWEQSVTSKLSIMSLVSSFNKSHPIKISYAKGYIFGDTTEQILHWAKNALSSVKRIKPVDSCFIKIKSDITPDDFPESNADIVNLIEGDVDKNLNLILNSHPAPDGTTTIMLGADTPNGIALGAVSLGKPQRSVAGFRANKLHLLPLQMKKSIYLSDSIRAVRHKVVRADHNWVYGRGIPSDATQLSSKFVTLIGCGSLGGGIAKMLSQAGVGKITLIDPDILKWQNTSRHEIGGYGVGQQKAKLLAEYLSNNFPHTEFNSIDTTWQDLPSNHTALNDTNLIISTTGDWSCESQLNEQISKNFLYGWTEPYAAAGHGLAILEKAGCFRCGFDAKGKFLNRVTQWPNPTLRHEPACGVTYQPYGMLELTPVQMLLSEMAIDVLLNRITVSILKTWVGKVELIAENGGELTDQWKEKVAQKGHSSMHEQIWDVNNDCPICSNA